MSEALRARAAALPLSDLVDAAPERRIVHGLRRLSGRGTAAGWARTVRAVPGDAASVHDAVRAAGAGDMIVVDYGGPGTVAGIGALVAAEAQRRGVAGIVLWGSGRDAAQIGRLDLSVYVTGLHPAPGAHDDPGTAAVDLEIGGATIRPGDLIVADDDGVAAFDPSALSVILDAAEHSARLDAELAAGIAGGTCLWDLPQLRGYLDAVDGTTTPDAA
jgi:regulator of RNase E activity RraA